MTPPALPPVESLTSQSPAWESLSPLVEEYKKVYGELPDHVVRVPGRVNLIGEHIDYNGFNVLPMAIEKYITVVLKGNQTGRLRLHNTASSRYSSYETELSAAVEIDSKTPSWHNYFLCGVKGVLEAHSCHGEEASRGLDAVVSGTVPPSAGLSSSSALVCAAALATCVVHKIELSKVELSELCAKSERYIGTQGGGMDQAIAFLAQPGVAMMIDFNPIRTQPVQIPPGLSFVVAHTGVEMNKSASAHFNSRVVECQIAAKVLAKQKGLPWCGKLRLAQLLEDLEIPLEESPALVKQHLHKSPYTLEELCHLFQLNPQQFQQLCLTPNTTHLTHFKLYQRALHVYEEALRVQKFRAMCQEESPSAEVMGQLMIDSHNSLQELYECSHPELDLLVECAVKAGALGSRLTGAGWGGCTVSLVPQDKVQEFMQTLESLYYSRSEHLQSVMATTVFSSLPGGGATVYNLVPANNGSH